jgi:hypothetical protein
MPFGFGLNGFLLVSRCSTLQDYWNIVLRLVIYVMYIGFWGRQFLESPAIAIRDVKDHAERVSAAKGSAMWPGNVLLYQASRSDTNFDMGIGVEAHETKESYQ